MVDAVVESGTDRQGLTADLAAMTRYGVVFASSTGTSEAGSGSCE